MPHDSTPQDQSTSHLYSVTSRDIGSFYNLFEDDAYLGALQIVGNVYIILPNLPYFDTANAEIETLYYEPIEKQDIPQLRARFPQHLFDVVGIARLYKPSQYGIGNGREDYTVSLKAVE